MPETPLPQVSATPRPPRSPYSPQYETVVAQGHERPTPSFGAPSLVWHVAVWPRRQPDDGGTCDFNDTADADNSDAAKDKFKERWASWIAELNAVLERLQGASSPRPGGPVPAPKTFTPILPHEFAGAASTASTAKIEALRVLQRNTLAFTLWWADSTDPDPAGSALRVRVHAEANADYACFSFYLDIAQAWNAPHDATAMRGERRSRLLQAAADVRDICAGQFEPGPGGRAPIDMPPLPEHLQTADGRAPRTLDEDLRAARNLLYVDIWEELCAECGCGLATLATTRGEVFANIRGLVLDTPGLPPAAQPYQPAPADMGALGSVTFPAFSASNGLVADGAEANAVVKAYWPFVRRITPRADHREFIACGVLNWRAIFITALGSSSQYVRGEERAASDIGTGEALIRVPPGRLPAEERAFATPSEQGHYDGLVQARAGTRGGNNHPVRYLLLTKHAPNPRQIGRITERINAMGTMRLFALKDWAGVRNADPYIRILGQELDKITEQWSNDKNLVNTLRVRADVRTARADIARMQAGVTRGLSGRWNVPQLERLHQILPSYVPRSPANIVYRILLWLRFHALGRRQEYFAFLKQLEEDLVGDVSHTALYRVSSEIETRLLEISSRLDALGKLTVGGLHFRLGRSDYYVREFEVLLRTLQVTNIPTWVSYEQFVQRGLVPAFDYMSAVGRRLRAVRERLLSVTEMIETSALVGQAAATRHNTAVLRQTTTVALVLLTLYLVRIFNWCALVAPLRWLSWLLPERWRGMADQVLGFCWS